MRIQSKWKLRPFGRKFWGRFPHGSLNLRPSELKREALSARKSRSLISALYLPKQALSVLDSRKKGSWPTPCHSSNRWKEAEALRRRETVQLQPFCTKVVREWINLTDWSIALGIACPCCKMFAQFPPRRLSKACLYYNQSNLFEEKTLKDIAQSEM